MLDSRSLLPTSSGSSARAAQGTELQRSGADRADGSEDPPSRLSSPLASPHRKAAEAAESRQLLAQSSGELQPPSSEHSGAGTSDRDEGGRQLKATLKAILTSEAGCRSRGCVVSTLIGGTVVIALILAHPVLSHWQNLPQWFKVGQPRGEGDIFLTNSLASTKQLGALTCNVSMPFPQRTGPRTWDIDPIWRRVCEVKNHQNLAVQERNWCWVGIKDKCHNNLKAHFTWEELQEKASKAGASPRVVDAAFHPLENPEVCDRAENGEFRNFTQAEKEAATTWFKTHVKTYVLNLPWDTERWHMIAQRMRELDIKVTRVSGVDMRDNGTLALAKQRGWVHQDFNFTRAQVVAYRKEQSMGCIIGTLGCASAHFKVQDKILLDEAPIGLVLEDDSYPVDDFIPRLWSMVRSELPCDWNIVALYSRCPYGKCISQHLARIEPDANEPAWRCHHGVNWGMQAVLYRTHTLREVQRLWKPTVFDEERPRCMDVDVALASISDKVNFYAVPNVQYPGFVKETNHRSARWDINQAGVTTTTSTSFIFVPKIKPGEPWPGAWNFG